MHGYIWGRGAADMKNELATRAVAIAWLARNGFQPAGDLVLIAEADEEDGEAQVGMPWLVASDPRCAPTTHSTRAPPSGWSWPTGAPW